MNLTPTDEILPDQPSESREPKEEEGYRRNGIDRDARAGVINFEIPAHRTLTEAEAWVKREKMTDGTVLMFGAEEMKGGRLAQ